VDWSAALRPLVAVSKPNYRDLEQWKPAQFAPEMVKLLRGKFRLKFPKVQNSDNPEDTTDKPWPYKDEDVKIVKAYSSDTGWSVAYNWSRIGATGLRTIPSLTDGSRFPRRGKSSSWTRQCG
jgi:hypothetical protein